MASPLIDPASTVVLQHAVRRWQAESENAGRLATRENGILGVIAMLLGLSLFRAPVPVALEPIGLVWAARVLVSLSVAQALVALGMVLWTVRRQRKWKQGHPSYFSFATAQLVWPGSSRHMKGVFIDEAEANLVAARVLTDATIEFYGRNAARQRLLDTSQRFIFGAALCAGLAMTCYLYVVPKTGPGG